MNKPSPATPRLPLAQIRLHRIWVICLCAGIVSSWPARGQLAISVGDHQLLANTPSQSLVLTVQNTGAHDVDVAGLTFNVQIEDGQNATIAPTITSVDILTGTVFDSPNNSGQIDSASQPHFWVSGTTTPSGTVTLPAGSSTNLATIVINTTGFSSSSTWAFNVGSTLNGPTKFFDGGGGSIFPAITDGHISVVPEPNGALVTAALLGVLAVAWRRMQRGDCFWAAFAKTPYSLRSPSIRCSGEDHPCRCRGEKSVQRCLATQTPNSK